MSTSTYPAVNSFKAHHSMKIKSIYALGAMFCFMSLGSNYAAQPEQSQVLKAPKLLKKNPEPLSISLPEALTRALTHYTELKLMKNQREQKHAEKWVSFSALFPKLKLTSAYTRNIPEKEASLFDVSSQSNLSRQVAGLLRKSGDNGAADQLEQQADLMMRRGADKTMVLNPKDVVDAKLSLEVPLFQGLSIAKAFMSHENVKAYDAKVEDEKAKTIYHTAKAYYAALYLQDVVTIRAQEQVFAEQLYKKAQSQRRSGSMMEKDYQAVDANQWQKKADLENAQLNYRASLGELGLMIGMSEEYALSTPDAMMFDALNTDADTLRSIAVANRPDIKASQHALNAFNHERRGHILSFLPTLGLRGDINYTSNDKSLMGENVTYALSINASMSLFDGGLSLQSMRQSMLKEQEQAIKQAHLTAIIGATIRGRKEKLVVLALQEKASEMRLLAAQEAARVALDRYNKALIQGDDFLEIEDKKVEAALGYKKSQFDSIEEKLALTYEAGLLTTQWVK